MRRDATIELQRDAGNRAIQRVLGRKQEGTEATADAQGMAVVQRGEAPVHESIEERATGGDRLFAETVRQILEGRGDLNATLNAMQQAGMRQRTGEEMYAGNWMRDHSQMNTAMAHRIVGAMPRKLTGPTGETIGAEGAEDIITAVIRGLAFLHFGSEITNELVTPENIGVYTPEQHVDNPMGTLADDHLVRDSATGGLRAARRETESSGGAQKPIEDRDRDEQLAGRAFPGLQMGNPELFGVSEAGLGKHIYNAIEWTKIELSKAIEAGQTPTGRMHLGSALHAVEDYYAHSNFIEVALNSEIGRASRPPYAVGALYSEGFTQQAIMSGSPGAPVDTLYDQHAAGGRQAVTTGTAGGQDLAVSIGQIMLPKLPNLADKVTQKIDEALDLVVADEGKSTWEKIKDKLAEDDAGLAMLEVTEALDRHIEVPVYDAELTGINIPFTDRFIPTGFDTSVSSAGVVSAIKHYIKLYKDIQERLDEIETGVAIATLGISKLLKLRKKLKALIQGLVDKIKKKIRRMIYEFLVDMVERLTGIDIPAEKKKDMRLALQYAATTGVEHLRHGTSIESQLPGIVEEHVRGQAQPDLPMLMDRYGLVPDGKGGVVPAFALPPSHSEISKDHAPHSEHGGDQSGTDLPGYDVGEGSLFFELHRELATEADTHIIGKMQTIWDEQSQTNSLQGLDSRPREDRESVLEQARDQQAREQERALRENRTHRTYASEGPMVTDLMALVDLFISHPNDSTWWQGIVRSYVAGHEEEVLAHIRHRNMTRALRH